MAAKNSTPNSIGANTGAAKDDLFLDILEDSATLDLDVLANDPGSASLWSLDQNALTVGSQPLQYSSWTLASGAIISINADGTIHYDGTAAMQHLRAGVVFEESFVYTIQMGGNGSLSTAIASFSIIGENDLAIFSGEDTGSIYENEELINGTLVVTDVDDDESGMQASEQAGTYGTLTMNADGSWIYDLTADVTYLAGDQSLQETFSVQSIDGTAHDVAITILGLSDVAASLPFPAEEESRDTWQLNRAKIVHNGVGEAGDVEHQKGSPDYSAIITGFDAQSLLHVDLAQVDPGSIQISNFDYGNDLEMDTAISLDFKDGNNIGHFEIILLGVSDLSVDNLWLNGGL